MQVLRFIVKERRKGSGIWRVMPFLFLSFFFKPGKIRRSYGDGECFTREKKLLMLGRGGGDHWSHVLLDERTGYSTQAKEQGQTMHSSSQERKLKVLIQMVMGRHTWWWKMGVFLDAFQVVNLKW